MTRFRNSKKKHHLIVLISNLDCDVEFWCSAFSVRSERVAFIIEIMGLPARGFKTVRSVREIRHAIHPWTLITGRLCEVKCVLLFQNPIT